MSFLTNSWEWSIFGAAWKKSPGEVTSFVSRRIKVKILAVIDIFRVRINPRLEFKVKFTALWIALPLKVRVIPDESLRSPGQFASKSVPDPIWTLIITSAKVL